MSALKTFDSTLSTAAFSGLVVALNFMRLQNAIELDIPNIPNNQINIHEVMNPGTPENDGEHLVVAQEDLQSVSRNLFGDDDSDDEFAGEDSYSQD